MTNFALPMRQAGSTSSRTSRRSAGFTLMETLVVVAVIIVIAAIAIPIYGVIRQRKNKDLALNQIRTLGATLSAYTSQNNNMLPQEDSPGSDSWEHTAKPEAKDVWYNAMPRLAGRKGVGDFKDSPTAFYTKENILFIPGAEYPEADKKMRYPHFAVAFNTKLHRKDAEGKKERLKMSDIGTPSRTVVLLEQGLPGEPKTLEVQSKKDYDGSPKGSAKSFVGRYGGQGILYFADGHAAVVQAKDLLTETGRFPFPQTEVIWTAKPEDDPNKN